MKGKKVWIVSELFYPDETSTGYIMTHIAKAVAEDQEVHIICGSVGYEKITDKTFEHFNFITHHIRTINFNKNKVFGRLIKSVFLSLGMFIKGLISIHKDDKVFVVTNPPFIIPLFALLRRIKGSKLIILVHDIFPENLISSKIIRSKKNIIYRLAKRIFDISYRQANLIIVLGSDMLEIMRTKTRSTQNITVIENWANTIDIKPHFFSSNKLIKKFNLENKVVFTFAGNLGRVQGLEFLFKIITYITNPKVHFLFIGDGALLDILKNEVRQKRISSVTFIGSMSRNEQTVFLNAGHFGLVTLSSDLYGLGVPSKTYNIMAAGKPILFIGNKQTEVGKMIIKESCGYVFDESEEVKLLQFFNEIDGSIVNKAEIMGLRARRLAETRYSQLYILKKFKKVLF